MAAGDPKIVQLTNKAGENIYPVVPDDGKATIEITNVDPGEGAALQENHFIAVYGDATKIQTADIANGAVTSDKIDWTTFGASFAYFKTLTSRTTVNAGNYNYQIISGLTQTVSTVSEGKYILIANVVGNAPGNTDTYVRPYVNGANVGGSGIFTPAGGNQWGTATKIAFFTATSTSTTISIYYGGGLAGNYTMLENSSWLLLRIG